MGLFDRFRKKDKPTTNLSKEERMEIIKAQDEIMRERREYLEQDRLFNDWADNNIKGQELESLGKVDEAQKLYEKNVRTGADTPFTYMRLSAIYHRKKQFKKERDILKNYLKQLNNDKRVRESYKIEFRESLANVNQFLNTGKWKYDCLPTDPKNYYYEIKEAKTLLNSEDREKGISMLEDLMAKGSYNNTVYYTLYQTYKKDKRYDDCIRVCNNAIDTLGFFSNDRKTRWNDYLEKITKQKEKAAQKK